MSTKLKISEIKPNPDNPRVIKDNAFKKLVKSLKEFPEMAEVREVVVNKDHIILGGNMRFRAMQEAGWKEVPVKVVDWPEDKQREFIIKDNVSGGEWDWDMLANEFDMQELQDWGLDLPVDFDEEKEIEEDEAPEVSDEPAKSKPGEVYQLGRHRIMCGDSTNPESVAKLMAGAKAAMVFTDPPYGVDYQSDKLGGIMNDKLKGNSLYEFTRDAFLALTDNLLDDAGVYCWYEDKFRIAIQEALEDAGFEYKQNLIWNKGMNLSGADYQKAHENCLYLQLKDKKANWYGGRDKKTVLGQRRKDLAELKKTDLLAMVLNMQKESTVWDIDRDSVITYVHPTQKPVGLCARAIYNSSHDQASVLDTFLGSGSTLIACEQTGRTCYGMELDPKYTDVIRKRYAKFIGEEDWQAATPSINIEITSNGK